MSVKERIEELRKLIKYHNKKYHDEEQPELTDYEYDKLANELEKLESKHPEYVNPNSPTQQVGGSVKREMKKVKHDVPVISLQDAFAKEEIYSFVDKVNSQVSSPKFVVEMKIDGLSVLLRYRNGKLTDGITRGNGEIGESVYENILQIKNVPIEIPTKLDYLEVRGEVFMSNNAFERVTKRQEEIGGKKYKTPRNLAAGTIRQLDSSKVKERDLDMFIFNLEISEGKNFTSHSETLEWLEKQGFPTIPNYKICSTADEIWKYVSVIGEKRSSLSFTIDGAVIKVDNLNNRKVLGMTSKVPRWAIAFKYPPEQKETVIKDIKIQVGRTGRLTPLAILEPIILGGTEVSKATLHNQDFIDSKDIQIGDTVVIQKAGDIIPEVVRSILEKRPSHAFKYTIPQNCPICNSPTVREENGADTRCISDLCEAQQLRKISYFASKNAMDIEGLGENSVEALIKHGYISNIADIYYLEQYRDELIEKGIVGRKKSVDKLLNAIEKSKDNELEKLITGLGIKNVGRQTSRVLNLNFPDIDAIIDATFEQLVTLPDFGEIVANNILDFFNLDSNKELIKKLKKANVNTESRTSEQNSDNRFEGQRFVVTGTLPTLSRNEATQLIQMYGGKVSGSVSKKTSYVLAGEDAGSKLTKAQDLSLKIISEDEFKEMLK